MPSDETEPDSPFPLRLSDLEDMLTWECQRLETTGKCSPDEIRESTCCRACRIRTGAEKTLGVKPSLTLPKVEKLVNPADQTRPDRLIAVRRADLAVMSRWKCINPPGLGPCDLECCDGGHTCPACWASDFAEKALRGASAKLPNAEEFRNLDVWDLLNSFGETVRQLGGGFTYDFTTGKAYLRPPKFTGATMIPLHVVNVIPGETDVSAEEADER